MKPEERFEIFMSVLVNIAGQFLAFCEIYNTDDLLPDFIGNLKTVYTGNKKVIEEHLDKSH